MFSSLLWIIVCNPLLHGGVVALTNGARTLTKEIQYIFWCSAVIQAVCFPFMGRNIVTSCVRGSSEFWCNVDVFMFILALFVLTGSIYTAINKVGITNKMIRKKITEFRLKTMAGVSPVNQVIILITIIVALGLIPLISDM
ncbi:hypothetical protein J7297_03543 [Nakaseomyces glabratus]|nr:hypothetical protein J7296_03343 [Nakaseomyces glabratus]KAH7582916.1 hypothetical protein J7298_03539 [Nakaseomyces glabratus]KAH7584340.1 hypothetical protein J7297_03543 [Nakaseomyces glabratus]KAH7592435.1 hypothetical protein J7295_04648 [Nakaseomyces glabratus]KAH7611507.1 hypothetical protein J7292_03519 [Nakaseomyces glabratus]